MWLEKINPVTAPSAPVNSSAATSEVERSNPSRIAGTRASQVAKPRPLIKKTTNTALRHVIGEAELVFVTDDHPRISPMAKPQRESSGTNVADAKGSFECQKAGQIEALTLPRDEAC